MIRWQPSKPFVPCFISGSHGVGVWTLGFDRLSHVCAQSVGVVRFEQRHRVTHLRKNPGADLWGLPAGSVLACVGVTVAASGAWLDALGIALLRRFWPLLQVVKGLSYRRKFYLGQRYRKVDFNSVWERTLRKSGLPPYQRDFGLPPKEFLDISHNCPTHSPVPFLKEQATGVTKMYGVFLIYVIMPILQMRKVDTQLRMFKVSF